MKKRHLALLLGALTGSGGCALAATRNAPIPPVVPYDDHGACPFECCTYRTWTVEADTDVRRDRRDDAPVAFRVRAGERVDGITGVVVTTKLGKGIVRQAISIDGGPRLTTGDTLYVLRYVGEGFWKVWVRGNLYDADISATDQKCLGERRESKECGVQLIEEPETVWWVKVRNTGGQE
jgi:hypothetical protein